MPLNKIGEARRSHCVGNFGPGAVVEFRAGDAAISGVVGGMEFWDSFAPPPGLSNQQVTYERRLQKFLNVDGFRLPPVSPDREEGGEDQAGTRIHLAAFRFPEWLQCPECGSLRHADRWENGKVGDPARYCSTCSRPNKPVSVVPVRFVVACPKGHLQEFPWDTWVGHKAGCRGSDLFLEQGARSGLAGLILRCRGCGAERPMEGAFGKEALKNLGITCGSKRPWLQEDDPEQCDQVPRALQRGASNMYFTVTASALSIPPFTDSIQVLLDPYWADIRAATPEDWPAFVRLNRLSEKTGLTDDKILDEIQRATKALEASNVAMIRHEEYEKLCSEPRFGFQDDFQIHPEKVPPELAPFFDRVVRVSRLREVRAIRGFTRITPPSGEQEEDSAFVAPISKTRMNWLPAIEVRGEGVFLRFNGKSMAAWEKAQAFVDRATDINRAYVEDWRDRHGPESKPPREITPRFLLVHSFAHALIRQLTIASGYSSASLRERLYIDDKLDMAGVLVYTATPDSDGSLGGLERQGRPKRIAELVVAAIGEAGWCSNDPLCIRDVSTFSDELSGASCHACMMVPETSCEEFNLLLDRATLVGNPDRSLVGYFSPLLNPTSAI